MKKLLLVLGMVLSLATVTACGSTTEVAPSSITAEQAQAYAESYISLISDVAAQGVDIAANAEYFETYCGIKADVMTAAVDSFNSAVDEIGTYQGGVSDVNYSQDGNELTISGTITGSKNKTANVVMNFDMTDGSMTSSATNVNYSIGDLMTMAGQNTILGVGTVFIVLIILWGVISCFKIVPYLNDRKAKKNAGTKSSVDNAVAQIIGNEETQDDTELIAVIAAAIAASEGAASSDGYVVRSVRRRY